MAKGGGEKIILIVHPYTPHWRSAAARSHTSGRWSTSCTSLLSERPKIMVDNQGAIDLVGNPVHHRRTKHIEVRFHIARTAQESGEILVTKVHTSDNHADILTKGTAGSIFRRHVSAIMHSLAPAA